MSRSGVILRSALLVGITALLSAPIQAQRLADRTAKSTIDTKPPALSLPASVRAEASSRSGATVNFTVSATDDVDRRPAVSCSPASGTVFPMGSTTVSCSSTDKAGNKATGSFAVSVVDTTAPTLALPAPVTAASTASTGVAVTYSVAASDRVDAAAKATCTPASGSTFTPGTTTVRCGAADFSGNQRSGSFNVTVSLVAAPDTTAPVLSLPASLKAEATSSTGAAVKFTAGATDNVDGSVAVSCAPASGAIFPLGSTTVQCSSSDLAGNRSSGSFLVAVADTTAPAITLPGPVTAEATSNTGVAVTYSVAATDRVDAAAAVQCAPASGSVFPPGSTAVRCSAADASGNQSSAAFDVTVSVAVPTTTASTTTTPTTSTAPTPSTTPTLTTGSAVLSWSTPTTRADGRPLAMSEIAGYEVYMLAESTGESKVITVDDPFSTSRTIDGLTPDTYHFAVSAMDTSGLLSDMSPTVSKQIR